MRPLFLCLILLLTFSCVSNSERNTVSLNGNWDISESKDTIPPTDFPSTISVPGLVDLASPQFDSAGYTSSSRKYFWYRKKFTVENVENEFAILKLHKVKFGHAIYLNDNYIVMGVLQVLLRLSGKTTQN
jgi:hypothetical protein